MFSGLADSVPKSEIYQCKLQPTDFVRGNVDLKTTGGYLLVVVCTCMMPVISPFTSYIPACDISLIIVQEVHTGLTLTQWMFSDLL